MQKLNREKSLKRIQELTQIHLAKKNGLVGDTKSKSKHTETLSESEDSDTDTKMKSEEKKKFENKGTVSKSKLENKR